MTKKFLNSPKAMNGFDLFVHRDWTNIFSNKKSNELLSAITEGKEFTQKNDNFKEPTYSPEGWPIRTINYTSKAINKDFKRLRLQGVLFERKSKKLNSYEPFKWLRSKGEPYSTMSHSSVEYNEFGTLKLAPIQSEPIGGAAYSYIETVVSACELLNENRLFCDKALAFGKYEQTHGDANLGFCVLGDSAEKDYRGYNEIIKYTSDHSQKVGSDINHLSKLIIEPYAKIIFALHAKQIFHGNPHLNNFVFDAKEVNVKDYEEVKSGKNMTLPQRVGYRFRDIRCALVSISMTEEWLGQHNSRLCMDKFIQVYFDIKRNDLVVNNDFEMVPKNYGVHMTNTPFDRHLKKAQTESILSIKHPLIDYIHSLEKNT